MAETKEEIHYLIEQCVNSDHTTIAEFLLESHSDAFAAYLANTEPESTFHYIELTTQITDMSDLADAIEYTPVKRGHIEVTEELIEQIVQDMTIKQLKAMSLMITREFINRG